MKISNLVVGALCGISVAGLSLAAAAEKPLKVALDGTFAPHAMPKMGGGIEGFNVDLANEIGTPDDLSAVDGFGEVTITGRKVTGSIDPLATLIAAYDWVTKWKADTATALNTGAIGATAGNIYTLSFPKAQIQEIGRGERGGVLSREIAFLAGENVADDEISLAFT